MVVKCPVAICPTIAQSHLKSSVFDKVYVGLPNVSVMVQRIQEIVSRKEEMLPRYSKFQLILSSLFTLTICPASRCLHDGAAHSRNRTLKRRNVTERFIISINFSMSFYINYVRLSIDFVYSF